MKAQVSLEYIGYGDNASANKQMRFLSGLLEEKIDYQPIYKKPWVAKIVGLDPQYKYARTFLPSVLDFSKTNSVGTRGVYMRFILESGFFYEINERVSWKNWTRYFCKVDSYGDIKIIPENKVEAYYKLSLDTPPI